jgi:hypothetical protein
MSDIIIYNEMIYDILYAVYNTLLPDARYSYVRRGLGGKKNLAFLRVRKKEAIFRRMIRILIYV